MGVSELWACDPDASAVDRLVAETPVARGFASFEESLAASPDAVFVCMPPKLHVEMCADALNAGVHVFCEKPLAHSGEGVEHLREAVAASGRQFMVGFCFRYHDALRKAKQYLDEGRIGRLVSIRCRMGEHLPTVRPDYRSLFTSRYSGAFDLTHEIDLACWFAEGLPIEDVRSIYGKFSDVDMSAPDLVEILVRFGEQCVASVHLDFFSRPRCRVTELLGTRGMISVDFASWDESTVAVFEASRGDWQSESIETDRDDMFRAEDAEFLGSIGTGGASPLGLEEALRSLTIVTAAQEADSRILAT